MKYKVRPSIIVENTRGSMYAKRGSVGDTRQVFDEMPRRDLVSWTAMIIRCVRHGDGEEAINLFWQMQCENVKPNGLTFVGVLKACASPAALEQGKWIHAHIIKFGFESDVSVGNTLVSMYAKAGTIEHARHVFDKIPKRNVVSWNAMLAGYVRHGHGEAAIKLFSQMQHEGMKPDVATFITILKACAGLESLDQGYAQRGYGERALELFGQMQQERMEPDRVTFVSILKACASIGALEQGKQVHAHIIKSGIEADVSVRNALVNMYDKCGSINQAQQVFNKMPRQDVVSWNVMIAGYVQHGLCEEALKLFHQMKLEGIKPDDVTFISVLKACANQVAMKQGKQIHAEIIRSGLEFSLFVGSTLIDMYAKCGSINHARQVFDQMPKRNIVSWMAMLNGYARYGHAEETLKLFGQMRLEIVNLNNATFVNVLKACICLAALEQGKQIHAHIIKLGFESDVCVGSTLVDMYAKCGRVELAHQVFDRIPKRDLVLWTTMVAGYVQHGYSDEALRLFQRMQWESVKPDRVTFVIFLKACASLAALKEGIQIHAYIIESVLIPDIFVENSLIDMYAKCGRIDYARQMFDKMPQRDVISWNAMVAGNAQHGLYGEALKVFGQMQEESVKPDQVTFVSILKACASVAALEQGQQLHSHIIKNGFESDVSVRNALVDMYAKCGNIKVAHRLFEKMAKRSLVTWNAMIVGYARHGNCLEALKVVERMQEEGVKPNHITFICILSACSHAGLVDEGCQYFYSMTQNHGITPAAEHYSCMVDLLGRAGQLEEADNLIKKIPFQPSAIVWGAFLGACRLHDHVELASYTVERILELEPHNTAAFVLLSNIHGAANRWVNKAKIRKVMEDRDVKKQPGCTWVEINNQVHSFIAEDAMHPHTKVMMQS